jgi:peptidoglycan/xylan/chitin deacetylase (PgdA/CDA1 family)
LSSARSLGSTRETLPVVSVRSTVRQNANRPPPLALAYHGVADVPLRDDPNRLFVRADDLRRHVARVRRWGYEFTTFGDLARRAAEGNARGFASLTFDDGFADNLHALVPLLRELHVPATVFVPSALLGGPHPEEAAHRLLTAAELAELAASGVEIGGHSRHHVDLTALSYDDALEELRVSRAELEAIVGSAVDTLAYPFGKADEATVKATREAGYVAACLTSGEGSWDDPYQLPRIGVNNRDTALGLWLKRYNRYEPAMQRIRPLLRNPIGGRAIGASRRLRVVGERLRQRASRSA